MDNKKIQMNNRLLLGSKSPSRQMLLNDAQIPFVLVGQDADETKCDWGLALPQIVSQIARYKMEHVLLSAGRDNEISFVLTADTLSQDKDGTVQGKPIDRADAIAKIRSAREGARLCSAFCLDKKVWQDGEWHLIKRIEMTVGAEYQFVIPDEWIPVYLDRSIGLNTAGAVAIEGFGSQFLKIMHGSYSAIVGLPMFELREALAELGFFD